LEMLYVGERFETRIRLSQAEVEEFRRFSGDSNPIHDDIEGAERSAIGREAVRSVHGMHVALVFTRILGTQFPGAGTVYRSLMLEFDEPVLVDTEYIAEVSVLSVDRKRHRARVLTLIREATEPEKTNVFGIGLVIHKERI